ncbi:MAG: DoxX family protein [Flavobacteriales bacterium]|nr:DoxX family protein [Flavobacteriales bacterium]
MDQIIRFYKENKVYFAWTIRVIVSVLFLFSAYSKLYPSADLGLGTMEVKQLYALGFSRDVAPYFSRLLVAAEFALGIGILQPHFLKRIVVPATILLLVVFCVHLTYSIANDVGGNCGCFGELIKMTPLEALIKNIITIGLLVWLMRMLPKDKPPHNFPFLALIYALCALALFMISPIQKKSAPTGDENITVGEVVIIEDEPIVDTIPNEIPLDTNTTVNVDNPDTNTTDKDPEEVIEKPKDTAPKKVTSEFSKHVPASIKLDEGKKILCLFAPTCEHCMETAKTLTEMRKKDPNFPKIFIIFMDEGPEEIPNFFDYAGAKYSYKVEDIVSFWEIIGMSKDTPGVVYLWNGNVRYFSDGIDANAFSEGALRKELDKKK